MRIATRRAAMSDKPEKPDSGKIKGPGGLTMRELHDLVKKSHARDLAAKPHNALAQRPGRWQRFVRYVWDKKRG